jgi:hypothetical protein
MKTLYRIFLFAVFFVNAHYQLYSQTWPKYYGQNNKENYSEDVEESYDKGYLICGNIYNTSGVVTQFSWIIKTDINGDTLWSKIIKNEQQFLRTFALEQTMDGGFLISGLVILPGKSFSNPYVMKVNACGEKEWCKVFDGTLIEFPYSRDVRETPTGDVILLVNQYGVSPQETLHLFKLSGNGDVLWKNPYASGFVHPLGAYPFGWKVTITPDGKYLVAGSIYWPDPWNPGGPKSFRPLFVMVSPSGEEEWILPFGLNDSIRGESGNFLEGIAGNYIGIGYKKLNPYNEGLIMEFDAFGNEVNFKNVNAKEIDTSFNRVVFGHAYRHDSLIVYGGVMGVEASENPTMEAVSNSDFFSNLNFYESLQHVDYKPPYALGKAGNKILSSSTFKQSGNWDIVLGKLNLNLEYDTLDPGTYTYDSLCTTPGLPQSGFIFLDDCDIITGTDIPSPEEYHASVQTIVVTAYPNPAETEITLAFQNTEHHNNMLLECYNLFGQRVHSEMVYKGQQKTKLSVEQWQSGLYIAVVKSDGRVAGNVRFVRR